MPIKPIVALDAVSKKPSKLYDHLKCIHKGHMPASKIKAMWIDQLPLELQLVMTALRNQNAEKLVTAADKMMEIYEAQIKKPKIHELLLKQRIDALSDKIDDLSKTLKKLSDAKKNESPDTGDPLETRMKMDGVLVKGAERKPTILSTPRKSILDKK